MDFYIHIINQDEINNLDESITSNKIQAVVKNKSLSYKRPDSDAFTAEFYHTFQ